MSNPSIDKDRLARLQANAEEWALASLKRANDGDTTTIPSSDLQRKTNDLLSMSSQTQTLADRMAERRAQWDAERQEKIERLTLEGITCVECEDTGRDVQGGPCRHCDRGSRIRSSEHDRERETILSRIPAGIGIPPRFTDFTLATFPNQHSSTLAQVNTWLATERPAQKPGLFIYGGFGRGKTGLAIGLLREMVTDVINTQLLGQGIAYMTQKETTYGMFTTATGLLESLRPKDGYGENDDLLRSYQTTGVLALDDLGSERLTEWGVDRLFEVVNERHNYLRPMLVTSNLSPSELSARINRQIGDQSGDRIVERLIESCTVLRFDEQEPNQRMVSS